ncbi:dephospho-CoA kinase [Lacinutrix undariae]
MKIIGLTGGIGSGKTTVANMFQDLGVPIYIADTEAKKLLNTSKILQNKLLDLFGENAYTNKELNRKYIASKVFNDKMLLQKMNAIVHPKVAKHFKKWAEKQNAPYVIKEVAIIFEHNMESKYDAVILVTADKETRIQRVLKRDNSTREKVLAVMNNQLSEVEKIKRADFIIDNDNLQKTKEQVVNTHKFLLENEIIPKN